MADSFSVINVKGKICIAGLDRLAVHMATDPCGVDNRAHASNGMLVTNDNSTLVIAESHGKRLTAFNINKDSCKK